jgi:hypothetical protein
VCAAALLLLLLWLLWFYRASCRLLWCCSRFVRLVRVILVSGNARGFLFLFVAHGLRTGIGRRLKKIARGGFREELRITCESWRCP